MMSRRELTRIGIAGAACLSLTCMANGAGLVDEFNDDTLDPAWNIAFVDDGGGWTYEETGGQLVVTDVVDNVDDSVSNIWGRVRLTQDTAALIPGDFTFETQFSWDSNNLHTAMQSVRIGVYDDVGAYIATAMHNDAWYTWSGGPYASTPGEFTFPGNNLAPLAGTSTATMQRVGDQINIDIAGTTIGHVGTSSAPIAGVFIEFSFYRYDVGPSTFGSLSVDYVRLTPEPGSLALLTLSGLAMRRRRATAAVG